jgi:hypothetical protein
MKVIGLDNREYSLILKSKPRTSASKPHIRARELLKKLFPNEIIYEEVLLKGSKRFNKKDLYADFFIRSFMLLIEVHGEQHYEKTFFHSSKLDFIQARSNDARKREWCELNNIKYVELPSRENENEWTERILESGND